MGVLEAWKEGFTGVGIFIGIVDDGVDYNHKDLINKIVTETYLACYGSVDS